MAVALKRENPARTATQVRRILRAQMGWAPGERTLQRHFAADPQIAAVLGALAAGGPGSEAVFGRFEADRPNELWTGDALHGPTIGGRKTYLFAFLDDHSRAIVGHRFGFAEDTVRLAAALRPALGSRGVPDGDLRRQRVRVRRRLAAARLRQARHPADPLHPGPPAGPREDRTVLPDRPRAVPGRDHRRAHRGRRRSGPAPGRRPGRAEPVVHRLGRDRLPPPRPLRDRAATAGPLARRRPVPAARPRPRWPRRSSGRRTARSPRPRWCRCRATPTRSTRCWSGAGSSWCSTRST